VTRATEDDVEGHSQTKHKAPDGFNSKKKAVEDDDVEGHVNKKHAPEGHNAKRKAVDEDDVEGHVNKKHAPDDFKKKAVEDDVEGHMIGTMNPVMARELARAKEHDIQRAASRGNLISDVKRAIRRKD